MHKISHPQDHSFPLIIGKQTKKPQAFNSLHFWTCVRSFLAQCMELGVYLHKGVLSWFHYWLCQNHPLFFLIKCEQRNDLANSHRVFWWDVSLYLESSELSDRGVLFVAVQVLCALMAPPVKSRTNDTWTHFWLSLLTNQAEFGNLKQLRTSSKVWLFWTMTEAPEQRDQSHFRLFTLSPPACREACVISANPTHISWIS